MFRIWKTAKISNTFVQLLVVQGHQLTKTRDPRYVSKYIIKCYLVSCLIFLRVHCTYNKHTSKQAGHVRQVQHLKRERRSIKLCYWLPQVWFAILLLGQIYIAISENTFGSKHLIRQNTVYSVSTEREDVWWSAGPSDFVLLAAWV